MIRSRIFFDFFILLYLLLFSFRFPVENPFFNNCGFFFPNKKMSQVVVDNLCVVSGFHRKTKISHHRCACIIASDMNVADSFLPPNHRPLRPSTAAFATTSMRHKRGRDSSQATALCISAPTMNHSWSQCFTNCGAWTSCAIS